jgi:hypothetical protein
MMHVGVMVTAASSKGRVPVAGNPLRGVQPIVEVWHPDGAAAPAKRSCVQLAKGSVIGS